MSTAGRSAETHRVHPLYGVAERCASAAPESRSVAEAVGRQLQAQRSARVMQGALTAQALSQDRLGKDLMSNLLQLCQCLLLPRDPQRYKRRVRPCFLQSL